MFWWDFLIVAVTSAVVQIPADSFDFQGARLGMSLKEFKRHPTWKRAKCKLSMPYAGILPSTVCSRSGLFKLEPFSGTTVISVSFITAAAGGPPRLAKLSVKTDISNAAETGNALVEKFGFRPVVDASVAQNAFGATLPTATATWTNKTSSESVVLSAPCDRRDQMCLDYILLPLVAARTEEIQRAMRAQAKRY